MRILVIYREESQLTVSVSPEALHKGLSTLQSWVKTMTESGKVKDIAFLAEGRGGIVMFNVDSFAELHVLAESMPLRLVCSVEMLPLFEKEDLGPALARIATIREQIAK